MKRSFEEAYAETAVKMARDTSTVFDPIAMAHSIAAAKSELGASKVSESAILTKEVAISREVISHLMTPENQQVFSEETGCSAEYEAERRRVVTHGTAENLKRGQRLLQRVELHCRWGSNEKKCRRLLRLEEFAEVVQMKLSPMTVSTLKTGDKTLNSNDPDMTLGKDRSCDLVISDPMLSRQHCTITLDNKKGEVYIHDLSTNGTFLNGVRLPSKNLGKVVLSHGDEVLLKDPKTGNVEFGYMVNINVVRAKARTELNAPRRILTASEKAITPHGLVFP